MPDHDLLSLLEKAFVFRQEQNHLEILPITGSSALRLFNGFWEGFPGLAVDLYGRSLVFHGYTQNEAENLNNARLALGYYTSALPFAISAAILKNRGAADPGQRRGVLLSGNEPDSQIIEHGIRYALNLRLHQDASLYLDTRLLRAWAVQNLSGAHVLNTFAYTGSLGAASTAAGASRVIQTDLSSEFLSVARETYRLNGWEAREKDFLAGDFFSVVARLKGENALFDCIFLDPPFFSATEKGRFDLNYEMIRLINKVRPLVGDGGWLVAINNALFVSGQGYLESLQELTHSGYVEIDSWVSAPADFTGFNAAPIDPLPADPAPFTYSTKIALLRVKRKDGRKAPTVRG